MSQLENAVLVSNDPADTPKTEAPTEAVTETPSADAAAEGAESKPADESAESESETGEAEQGSDDEAPKQPKKKGGFQRRIDQLTREKADLERRLAENAAKPSQQNTPPVDGKSSDEEPKADDFQTYEAYVKAIAKHAIEQERKAAAKAEAERNAAREQAERSNTWSERVSKAREVHDDFDEVIAGAASLPVSEALHNAIVDSDRGPELAYYLASNPAEAKRLSGLSAFAQVRELGKIEARFDTPPAQPEAKVSRAPEPISPVKRAAKTASVKPDEMDFQAYKQWREADIAKRSGRR